MVFEAAFFVSIWTFRRKTFFRKTFYVLLTFSGTEWKIVDLLPKEIRYVWQNLVLRVHKNILNQKISSWKTFSFRNMSVLRTKKIQFFFKKFGSFVKTVSWIFVGTFRKKMLSRKKCISFIFFGHWAKKIWPCTRKTSMWLSKLQVTCLWDQCRERKVFERNMVFHHIMTSS